MRAAVWRIVSLFTILGSAIINRDAADFAESERSVGGSTGFWFVRGNKVCRATAVAERGQQVLNSTEELSSLFCVCRQVIRQRGGCPVKHKQRHHVENS